MGVVGMNYETFQFHPETHMSNSSGSRDEIIGHKILKYRFYEIMKNITFYPEMHISFTVYPL
jgi:hypothetical protein